MGRPKINDEFGKLPMSKSMQSFYRRDADGKEVVNKHRESSRKYGLKLTGKRVVDRRKKAHFHDKLAHIQAEAKRHQSKGRDVGQIAVWMNLPVSKVKELLSTP